MNIMRMAARPLLAAPFIAAGADAVRYPHAHRERAAKLFALAEKWGFSFEISPSTIDAVTRSTGIAMTAAGTLLALGKMPRTSAAVLAALQVPLALSNNPFWEKEGQQKRETLVGLTEAAGLIGGAMIAAADRVGKPSLSWLAHRKAADVAEAIGDAASSARLQVETAGARAASAIGVA